jgi:hypothetical protein
MNLITSTINNYETNTGAAFKYLESDDQLQTVAPTMKKLGSAVVFGLVALSATTADVPSYIRLPGAQRSTFHRTYDFGLGSIFKNKSTGIYAEQMDEPPLPKLVLASLKAAGVDATRAASIIKVIQSGLSDMGYPVLKIEARNLNDPEEGSVYVIVNLLVSASFEKALELDSTMARTIVKHFNDIPSTFNMAVKEVA